MTSPRRRFLPQHWCSQSPMMTSTRMASRYRVCRRSPLDDPFLTSRLRPHAYGSRFFRRYRSGPELESVPSGVGSFVSQPQVVSAGVALPELDIHWPDPPHGPLGRREVGFRLQSCEVARDDAISFLKIEKRCTLTTRQGDRLRRWVACSEVRADSAGVARSARPRTRMDSARGTRRRERDVRIGVELLAFRRSSPVAISNDPSAVTSLSTRTRASGRPSRSTVDT